MSAIKKKTEPIALAWMITNSAAFADCLLLKEWI